ncbi:hypothetical protein OSB04_018155 [Centaurea solstitialis]|uniref:Receptor-like serine/threonine-protein kinase n=1 Tax=Centaurea solstitialis TaxID=347529 RepID=A0AA38TG34_9ASTR|nr:hypothetical protein OSB04_018155 [Centaurea solstitialis]
MATYNIILFLFTIFFTFNLARSQSNITRGLSLTPTGTTTSWLSPSGRYAFGFYPQISGYAIGVYIAGSPEKTVVWTASRDTLPLSINSTLSFTTDGSLIVEQTRARRIDITGRTTIGASMASMQDSGNFVIYGSDRATVVWQTFDHPTDTLLVGQKLVADQRLFSSVSKSNDSIGIFKLTMQRDGNLVQYPNVGTPDIPQSSYWASGTDGEGPNVTLNLDSDGFLYLLKNSSFFISNLTQGGFPRSENEIYRMKIDVDGIFRLYHDDLGNKSTNGSSVIIWASSADKCAGKGLCGRNGYCVDTNGAAGCKCLPGFEFVDPKSWSLGCERNYSTVDSCKVRDGVNSSFRMATLYNIAHWEETAYAIPDATTQDDCSFACLSDCICEVAVFTGLECRLQKLPLRFIEVKHNQYNVGLIKVYASSVTNGSNPTNIPSIHVKRDRRTEILATGVSLIVFAVLVLLLSGVFVYRAKVWTYRKISENVSVQLFDDVGPWAFSYGELEGITDGFKEELGRGSFGVVYKGVIERSNKAVAVKKLKEELAQEGEREFQTEMKVIGRTHHRNLSRLLGYCCEGPERLLVMEYMTKGSLADVLFGGKESKPCWEDRIRMALDVAHGIKYLHEECETVIIHCDIKPQNILMDEYGCAKISDFGLAKLLEHDQTKTFTLIRGTRGYVAPEWHKKLPITSKVDVYSFGIVLFEILCCRRSVDTSLPSEEAILEEWVYDSYEADEVSKLVDDKDVDKKQLDRMIRIGLWCIQEDPSLRPSMKKVLLMLEGTVKIPVPPNPTSFLSIV